jgi:hypothetical protein
MIIFLSLPLWQYSAVAGSSDNPEQRAITSCKCFGFGTVGVSQDHISRDKVASCNGNEVVKRSDQHICMDAMEGYQPTGEIKEAPQPQPQADAYFLLVLVVA